MYSTIKFVIVSSSTVVPPLIRPALLQWKSGGLIRRVASPEGDLLIVFYYVCTYKIWPSKRGGF